MDILRKDPAITQGRISEVTGYSLKKVERLMKKMREKGMIQRVGSKKTGTWEVLR